MSKVMCFYKSESTASEWARRSDMAIERYVQRYSHSCVDDDGWSVVEDQPILYPVAVSVAASDAPSSTEVAAIASELHADAACWAKSNTIRTGEVTESAVKMVGFMKRAAIMTAGQFDHHWNDVHAAITLSYEPTFVRYVTNVLLHPVGDVPWDGIVEQWFGSMDDLAAHVELARGGRPLIAADVPRFVREVEVFLPQ